MQPKKKVRPRSKLELKETDKLLVGSRNGRRGLYKKKPSAGLGWRYESSSCSFVPTSVGEWLQTFVSPLYTSIASIVLRRIRILHEVPLGICSYTLGKLGKVLHRTVILRVKNLSRTNISISKHSTHQLTQPNLALLSLFFPPNVTAFEEERAHLIRRAFHPLSNTPHSSQSSFVGAA